MNNDEQYKKLSKKFYFSVALVAFSGLWSFAHTSTSIYMWIVDPKNSIAPDTSLGLIIFNVSLTIITPFLVLYNLKTTYVNYKLLKESKRLKEESKRLKEEIKNRRRKI